MVAPQSSPSCSKSITIWPLGDSITYGVGHEGDYRETLYTNLVARGCSVKLVGTIAGNSTPLLTDAGQNHHDGHCGYSITDEQNKDGSDRNGIYERVEGWHKSIDTPDVIL